MSIDPSSIIAATVNNPLPNDLYYDADVYDTGAPAGYYFDTYGDSSTDYTTSGGTFDLTNANTTTFVGYWTNQTVSYSITNYSTVNNITLNVGYQTQSTGTITMTSSVLTASDEMAVGGSGTGTINATHSILTANNVSIGKNIGSTGTVSLDNTMLNVSATLNVGTGTGHLTATNGSHINSLDGTIANSLSARGDVTLTGSGTVWYASHSLTIGYADASNAGIGTMLIEDDALLLVGSSGNGVSLSVADGSIIKLDGGFFAIYGDKTADEEQFLTDAHLQVWNGTAFVDATTANTSINYYTSGEWTDGDYLYSIYNTSLNLTGYTVIASTVPEPATYALFGGFGAAALVLLRKRRG